LNSVEALVGQIEVDVDEVRRRVPES